MLSYRTHKVAVGAFLFEDQKMLMLMRNTPPQVWAPPGGRLYVEENPVDGVVRECLEETNLHIRPIMPVDLWFGEHLNFPTIAIFYFAEIVNGNLLLSREHRAADWFNIEQIETLIAQKLAFGTFGFYLRAFILCESIRSKGDLLRQI